MIEPEVELCHLSVDEWREMLASASVLDLVHGGYYRARPQGIFFYASPGNAPEGWSGGFEEGSPEVPRALVGEAEVAGERGVNGLTVRLSVSNWTAVRAVKQVYDRGEFRGRFQEYVLAQEGALRGRPVDRAWLRTAFQRLREHAAGKLIDGD